MIRRYLEKIGFRSKIAYKNLRDIDIKKRNKVLETYRKQILKNTKKIIKENSKDLKNCKRGELIDRLIINKNSLENIDNSINEIIKFKDPLNKIIEK